MAGIRLHPNYHGYKLDDPGFARLLRMAARRRLLVQLAVLMEDERMMHPLLRVEPVDLAPLVGLVKQIPGLRLVLLNALGTLSGQPLADLIAAGEVYVEISMLEAQNLQILEFQKFQLFHQIVAVLTLFVCCQEKFFHVNHHYQFQYF